MGGGNSNYNIIRTPSKAEFDNFVVNTDLNGTLNSDFNTRKSNAWNYNNYGHMIADTTTFQDNTNNASTRFYWHWTNGVSYPSVDKNFIINGDPNHTIISANFRPIIEYRE